MSTDSLPHRLAAVWFADIVGYSQLTARNEDDALRYVRLFQRASRETVGRYGGRVVKFMGDGALAEFASTDAAVRAAQSLSVAFRRRAEEAGLDPPQLHTGVHVGEIASAPDGDIYGDGLNVAARLQAEAAPGQLLASEDVWRQLRHRREFHFEPLGERTLKGSAFPIEVYGVAVEGDEALFPLADRAPWSTRLRRPRLLAIGTAAVVAFSLLWTWSGRRPWDAAAPATSPSVVAVMPFSVQGSADLAYLEEGMVNLMGTKLSGVEQLRTVDPHAVLEVASRQDGGAFDADRGTVVARQFGAGLFVLGNIVEAGGRLHVDAALYEVGEKVPVARASVEGGADELFGLVDRLAAALLLARLEDPATGLAGLSTLTTDSLAALKAYLEGEREYVAGHFSGALEAFQRAVAIDSLFALAHYRLAMTATWNSEYELAEEAAGKALRHSARLSATDRLLVDALHASMNGDLSAVEQRLAPHLETHPEDIDAWFLYGDALLHGNPYRGRSMAEARPAFHKIVRLDPENMLPLDHLMWIAAAENRFERLDSLLTRLQLGSEFDLTWRSLRNFAVGDDADRKRSVADIEAAGPRASSEARAFLVTYAPPGKALEGTRALLRNAGPIPAGSPPWLGSLLTGLLELRSGRWSAAGSALERVALASPALGFQFQVLAATAPFAHVSRDEIAVLRRAVGEWSPAVWQGSEGWLDPLVRTYLLGLLDLELGDAAAASRASRSLAGAVAGTEPAVDVAVQSEATVRSFLAASLRARVSLHAGDRARALRELPPPPTPIPVGIVYATPVLHHPQDRYLRAELLRQEGRSEEAVGWYAALAERAHFADLPYAAMSQLRLSEIHADRGNERLAAAYAAEFVALWRHADGALQPLVTEARARASAVRS